MGRGTARLSKSGLRLAGALAGMALWFAYPFVFLSGNAAIFFHNCRLETASPREDPCFTDYIPVLELAAFGATLLLAWPFARYAFSLFAPHGADRSRLWMLAGRSAPDSWFPTLQVATGIGFVWLVLHVSAYPIALWSYHLYWAAWAIWFAFGLRASWPVPDRDDEMRT